MIPKPLLAIVAALCTASLLFANPPPCREGEVHATAEFGSIPRLDDRVATPIASLSLGDGDWDVSGNVNYFIVQSIPAVYVGSAISPDANIALDGFSTFASATTTPGVALVPCPLPRRRIHLEHDTTLQLIAYAIFAEGSVEPWGFISAVKVDQHH